jgi:hypothetical protein
VLSVRVEHVKDYSGELEVNLRVKRRFGQARLAILVQKRLAHLTLQPAETPERSWTSSVTGPSGCSAVNGLHIGQSASRRLVE